VRNNGAEDTSRVTRHEGDEELGALAVRVLRLGEDVSVEGLDEFLEGDELNNGVRNLSSPERLEASVETVGTLGAVDLVETLDAALGEGAGLGGLHTDLQGFPGAKQNIGDELSASRGDSPTDGLILGGVLTSGSSVNILEDFVETEFTEALAGVTDESRQPTEGETLEAFSSLDLSETVTDRLVETGTSLHSALDNIERANNGVSDTAGKDTTSHAFAVVREIVDVRTCHLDAFSKCKSFR